MFRLVRIPVLLALLAALAFGGVYLYGLSLVQEDLDRGSAAIYAQDPIRRIRLRPKLDRAEPVALPVRKGAAPASWRLTTDGRGIRGGRDLPYERPADRMRIVVVGDGGAFGWGVDDRDAWPAVLEAKLNEGLAAPAFDVVNGAVPGYLSAQGRVYFDTELRRYAPDALIVSFGARDAEACARHADLLLRFMPESGIYRRDPLSKKWLPVSRLFRGSPEAGAGEGRGGAFWAGLHGVAAHARRLLPEGGGAGEEPCRNTPLESYREHLAAFAEWGRIHGAELLYVSILPGDERYDAAMDDVARGARTEVFHAREFLREQGPAYYDAPEAADLRAAFEERFGPELAAARPELRYTADGAHPNALGSRLVAEGVAWSRPILRAARRFLDRKGVSPEVVGALRLRLIRGFEIAGDRKEALDEATRLLAQSPDDREIQFDVYRLRGAVAASADKLDEAAWNYSQALETGTERREQWLAASATLADLQVRRGDDAGAVATIETGLAHVPGDPRLTNYLGVAYVQQKKWAEGMALIETAHAAGFQDARSTYQYGWALYKRPKPGMAARKKDQAASYPYFREAYRLDQDGPWGKKAVEILPKDFDPDGEYVKAEGNAYEFTLPADAPYRGDSADAPEESWLVLLEDGKPLGPPHSDRESIARQGEGRYSHWEGRLLFSTSDNTDPNVNGRDYRVQFR